MVTSSKIERKLFFQTIIRTHEHSLIDHKLMRFEHLIEVNHLEDPRADVLSREQLWNGLLLRAKAPSLFIPHMDGFAIVEESDNNLTRTLDFGKFKVNDKVEFVPMEKLRFHIPAQGDIMESRLEITIEEPFPDRFFLRFIYEDSAAEEGPEAMYNDFRRSAYKEMDVDSMRLIRQFASQGRLDDPETKDKTLLS